LIGVVASGVAADLIHGRDIWRYGGSPIGAGLVALIICAPIFIGLDLLRKARARRDLAMQRLHRDPI
jgi:hypothetical protein